MIKMIITLGMFIVWLFVGGYNMVLAENINKFAFFCCWITLLLYIIAASII